MIITILEIVTCAIETQKKIRSYFRKKIKTTDTTIDPLTPKNCWRILGKQFINICEDRIKISNIKHYGVCHAGEYERELENNITLIFTNKKMYLTTYQNDNYIFFKEQLGNEFENIVASLDDIFAKKNIKD